MSTKKKTTKPTPIIQRLSVAIGGDEPPTEFRIFTSPVVDTVKGQFTFDARAAELVMAEYEAHGIDLALDYDHAMLGSADASNPSEAGKAAGWFGLEMRGGDLYAVNVRWTPPAAEALRRKEWRFVSPAFTTDEAGRITSLMNVALVNLPATRNLEPLMAASQKRKQNMAENDPTATETPTLESAIAALEAGDAEAALTILQALAEAEPEPEPEPEPTGPDEESLPELRAASRTLRRLTSTSTLTEAIGQVRRLSKELQSVARERDAFAGEERIRLCRSLVHDAGHAPARVWNQEAYAAGETPVPRLFLQKMTLVELRKHVEEEIGASVGKRGGRQSSIQPPVVGGRTVTTSLGLVELSQRELAMCDQLKLRIEAYAEKKMAHLRASDRSGETVQR